MKEISRKHVNIINEAGQLNNLADNVIQQREELKRELSEAKPKNDDFKKMFKRAKTAKFGEGQEEVK